VCAAPRNLRVAENKNTIFNVAPDVRPTSLEAAHKMLASQKDVLVSQRTKCAGVHKKV
jgi:hypothetical protein